MPKPTQEALDAFEKTLNAVADDVNAGEIQPGTGVLFNPDGRACCILGHSMARLGISAEKASGLSAKGFGFYGPLLVHLGFTEDEIAAATADIWEIRRATNLTYRANDDKDAVKAAGRLRKLASEIRTFAFGRGVR